MSDYDWEKVMEYYVVTLCDGQLKFTIRLEKEKETATGISP